MNAATVSANLRWEDRWRLPSLAGRRGTVALTIYGVAAVLIAILIAGSFWFNARDYFGNMPTAAEYGFRTRTEDGVPEVATVSRRELGRSDLRRHDRFVSIDGVRVPPGATEYTIAEMLSADRDGTVTIVTRSSEDGALRAHTIDRVPITSSTQEPSARMPLWLFITIGFLSAQLPLLAWFGASLFLAWRRPRDPEAMLLSSAFLLLCVTRGSAFWLNAFLGVPWSAIFIAENIGASLTLLAIAAFPDGRFANSFARWAIAAVAVSAVLAFVVELTPLSGRAADIAGLATISLVFASVWQRYRGTEDQTERQQVKWAVFGFCAALALFLPVVLLSAAGAIPADGPVPIILYQVVVQIAWMLMPIGVLISVMKFRLYDADSVIGRSTVYGLLTIGFVALFAASQKLIELLGQEYLGQNIGGLAGGIGAALAAVAIAPMHNRVQRWAERRFQRSLHRLRHALPPLVGDLRETAGIEQIAGATLDSVIDGVQARRAAMIVGDRFIDAREIPAEEVEEWWAGFAPPARDGIDCDKSDALFPVRVPLEAEGHGRAGWLLLGPRPDGSLFGKAAWDAIEEIAEPVARAVQVATRREEREARYEQRLSALEQAIASIEKRAKPATI